MIKTAQQLKATQDKLQQLKNDLAEVEKTKDTKHPLMLELEVNGLNSLIEELQNEIVEYESLSAPDCKSVVFACCEVRDFPELLIKARLVRNMSQTELAQKIGVSPQLIQRYEANGYDGVGFEKLLEIQYALGLEIELRGQIMNNEIFTHDETISEEEIEEKEKKIIENHLFAATI